MAQHTDVHLAVIGGSGLYELEGLEVIGEEYPETPWGFPADRIVIARASANGPKIAFLARHGRKHQFSPSEVPNRANIAALKHLGVGTIISFSAGIRESSFFEGGILAHASFADPFNATLANIIARHAEALGEDSVLHRSKTVVSIEGPAFSTRAESHLYRAWNCDVINMTAIPEAKLAREAEIAYQMVCMSTDYDCWKESEEAVTVQAVMEVMKKNSLKARALIRVVIDSLAETSEHHEVAATVQGSMEFAIMTPPVHRPAESSAKLRYILPQYFPEA
ncbi:nucleoside phosphorylase domain-containing protein [Dimargaris cristalligena]|uniref:S-methyl-5'-thioadenosine phosphorylase n=1 Tax=Dimargaris cristalligena TaxID=215637 RepID=A0A4Q0A3F0_9FUNG|nr:nucleoside phosphorylase domain-containing protein [Dimargaris cristalligena]|eukprot:RKP39790.1 nucleoside phosphorylase domain-containing protein [Dimargaris cristalligena]